ncbi:MAG: alpha/beta fold hydrolase [Alphaproteobacteria bacterium]|nr:alpha/beta fold hydrolase [Alphaproteobacteria bacterium]
MRWKRAVVVGLLGFAVFAAVGLVPRPVHHEPEVPEIHDLDAWLAGKQAEARAQGVGPGNEERLLRVAEGRTPRAILYVHGFGASRAEGEAIVDRLAEDLGANTLYTRLPGHGVQDPDVHAAPAWTDHIDAVEEAFAATKLLGERVVLVGTSAGGLLATWLAAEHPEDVDALVLASPFYDFADPTATLLDRPIGPAVVRVLYGETRDASWKDDSEGRAGPHYGDHWTTTQRYAAVFTLAKVRRFIATDEVFARVTAPTLLLCYYADEDHQDTAASVAAMREAFAAFNGGTPHPASRFVPIADGSHVLLSEHVRTDKQAVRAALASFFASL